MKSAGTEEVDRDKKQKDWLQHNLKDIFDQHKEKTKIEIVHNNETDN